MMMFFMMSIACSAILSCDMERREVALGGKIAIENTNSGYCVIYMDSSKKVSLKLGMTKFNIVASFGSIRKIIC